MQDWSPEELEKHIEKGDRVFLKLWKKGCGICKLSVPATDRLEAQNDHAMVFGRISTDDYPEMLEIADTEMLPTFFIFADKQKKGQYSGFKGLDKLKEFVEQSLTGS